MKALQFARVLAERSKIPNRRATIVFNEFIKLSLEILEHGDEVRLQGICHLRAVYKKPLEKPAFGVKHKVPGRWRVKAVQLKRFQKYMADRVGDGDIR